MMLENVGKLVLFAYILIKVGIYGSVIIYLHDTLNIMRVRARNIIETPHPMDDIYPNTIASFSGYKQNKFYLDYISNRILFFMKHKALNLFSYIYFLIGIVHMHIVR